MASLVGLVLTEEAIIRRHEDFDICILIALSVQGLQNVFVEFQESGYDGERVNLLGCDQIGGNLEVFFLETAGAD